jgi:hypothetical protein
MNAPPRGLTIESSAGKASRKKLMGGRCVERRHR